MLKKLQKIGIKFNYLKLHYLTLFLFFSVENRIGKEKEFRDLKIMFKSILFIIKCSPPNCDTTSCPFNHCIKCLFNHFPIFKFINSLLIASRPVSHYGAGCCLVHSNILFNVFPKKEVTND